MKNKLSPNEPLDAAAGSAHLSAWPAVPWPEDIWSTSIAEAGEQMRQAMGENATTAVSGTLLRYGWELAEDRIKRWLEENGLPAPNENKISHRWRERALTAVKVMKS